jgi:hypothetical protein
VSNAGFSLGLGEEAGSVAPLPNQV